MTRMYNYVVAAFVISMAACVDVPHDDDEIAATSEVAREVRDPSNGPSGPGSGPTMPPRIVAEPKSDEYASEAQDAEAEAALADEAQAEAEAAAAE